MRVEGPRGIALRYRLVPGSTVRWNIRMDLDLRIDGDGDPQTLDAMVTSRFDSEVQRVEGNTALVRPITHDSDFWVRGGTLDEDDVADPMRGFVKGFLLDDLGSVVPVADELGTALAGPDDGSAGRALLLALFPPYPEEVVTSGMQWEVDLHPSVVGTDEVVAVSCALGRLHEAPDGHVHPVVLHGLEYVWRREAAGPDGRVLGVSGAMKLAAETFVNPLDGWAQRTEARAEMTQSIGVSSDRAQTVTTRLRIVAERE